MSFHKFHESTLQSKGRFHNTLTGEDADYEHKQNIWQWFNIKNFMRILKFIC